MVSNLILLAINQRLVEIFNGRDDPTLFGGLPLLVFVAQFLAALCNADMVIK